ncbi:MAG: valine--tRNA ligase [Treponema sp.]|nr:valine--tRNA ligase [Treponema sp.]
MKAIELEKAYDPRGFEDKIYAIWKESGAFKPENCKQGAKGKSSDEQYILTIPPPNVTGILHLGHGLGISIMDTIIRYHRMTGKRTLWVPGTDHAGIATQHVVEEQLKEKGKSKHDLGREKFIEETWKVKNEHHSIISKQIARVGASVDWDRERFTLDEGLSRAVRDVFVTLYERDLLYKGNYLVNWCCTCGTALSDDEVEHEDTRGKMYKLRYPIFGEEGNFVELATTRPETILGDTAIAVHPEDERYTGLIGKTVILPLANRKIPVVADTYVSKDFGTGVVKITPAHDPNDRELALRHSLPEINILTPQGLLNDEVPEKYRGLNVKKAREAVLNDLKTGDFYIDEEDITHAIGHCYRCHSIIEPFLSEQWFVRMKPLAEKALGAWRRGEIIFYPRRWENTYRHWMENIRDWCISRQLWWGHRIPVWYCSDCGKMSASRVDLNKCIHCESKNIEQDPDVLDTWFSSWLWPFSVMGWENSDCDTEDFKNYYPTTVLITGYDIIFFWVARMIMAGLEFTGKAPFRDVYITQLIRDKKGQKMSKSKGNGFDPMEVVDEYGADALKFTLCYLCAQGQDILMDKESFKLGSKFANKVWNASRYILMNLEGRTLIENPELLPVDKWIYSRLNTSARLMEEAFLSYRFNDAAHTAHEYFWNDFCDWYVEATKLSIKDGSEGEKDRATSVLLDVLALSLRLLHPMLSFVTEEIYSKLPNTSELLMSAAYPAYDVKHYSEDAEQDFGFLQELVRQIRTLRSECTISPDKKIKVLISNTQKGGFLNDNAPLLKLLAGIGELEITESREGKPAGSIALAGTGFEAFVFIADIVDLKQLKGKFEKELEKDRNYAKALSAKLANEDFVKNAPPELVEGERIKLDASLKRTEKLVSYIKDMV